MARARPASTPPPPHYVACDPNIEALFPYTTCRWAENAFYEYWNANGAAVIHVYSPRAGRVYRTKCTAGEAWVVCTSSDHGAAKFSQASVDRYTRSEARAFASVQRVSAPGVSPDDAALSDPGYADGGAPPVGDEEAAIDDPLDAPPSDTYEPSTAGSDDSDFCSTHDCIPNYPNGRGSTVQCSDGSYSHSGGIQGACSHHGGIG